MRIIAITEKGDRIGEDHPQARITNSEVEQLLALREEGKSYVELAVIFCVSKSTVANICQGRYRSQIPRRWKQVSE